MLIHIYSTGYMAHEGGYYRFFGYLNLFMFSMLTLILANNYVLMFVGWEGVGLCSYLLIGFYFHRKSASDAANKAFIVNRIGDAGFILGMFFIAWYFGSLRFIDVNHLRRAAATSRSAIPYITAATLLLFVGACGKSAQLPLYVWLPDAMEGPTPVSALIHAATMVTAGVYMVARSNALLRARADIDEVGRHRRRAHRHLRRLDRPRSKRHQARARLLDRLATRLHVPGARRRSLLRRRLPRLHSRLLQSSALPRRRLGDSRHVAASRTCATWATCTSAFPPPTGPCSSPRWRSRASPPFAGFFSKDEILWETWSREGGAYRILWYIGYATALMTAFYMFRLMYLTFHGHPRMSHDVEHHIHESPKSMTMPLVVLAVMSLFAGFLGWPHSLGGSDRFAKFLEPVFAGEAQSLTRRRQGRHNSPPAKKKKSTPAGTE